MNFDFATANRILFGPGRIKELPDLARSLGRSALLITGRDPTRAEPCRHALLTRGVSVTPFSVPGEPTLDLAKEGATQARFHRVDFVIGYGGGSAIDAAKAIAALATNRRNALDYLEVIGKGEPLDAKPLPIIAIPTTAGTGAEVTRNAVLTSNEHKFKVSLRHPSMLPTVAILDPELTHSTPPPITAASGLDALSQLVEPFVSLRANPVTDGFCREGITLIGRSLRAAFENGANAQAREDMLLASLLGGLALANAGLGAVHGFAAPLGAMFNAPHGALCAILLPQVIRANFHPKLDRYEEIARLLTNNPNADPEDALTWIEQTIHAFSIGGLSGYGITEVHFPEIIAKAKNASSMKANPVQLTDPELTAILQRAL